MALEARSYLWIWNLKAYCVFTHSQLSLANIYIHVLLSSAVRETNKISGPAYLNKTPFLHSYYALAGIKNGQNR